MSRDRKEKSEQRILFSQGLPYSEPLSRSWDDLILSFESPILLPVLSRGDHQLDLMSHAFKVFLESSGAIGKINPVSHPPLFFYLCTSLVFSVVVSKGSDCTRAGVIPNQIKLICRGIYVHGCTGSTGKGLVMSHISLMSSLRTLRNHCILRIIHFFFFLFFIFFFFSSVFVSIPSIRVQALFLALCSGVTLGGSGDGTRSNACKTNTLLPILSPFALSQRMLSLSYKGHFYSFSEGFLSKREAGLPDHTAARENKEV